MAGLSMMQWRLAGTVPRNGSSREWSGRTELCPSSLFIFFDDLHSLWDEAGKPWLLATHLHG